MNSDNGRHSADLNAPAAIAQDGPPLSRWRKFRMIVKVVELRLRFVALMAATVLVFAYWDEIGNRYEKWMRPAAPGHAAISGVEFYCPMHPQVVQDEAGACPICGMSLAKRTKGEKANLPAGVTARVELAPTAWPRPASRPRGGVRTSRPDGQDRRICRIRRAANFQHRVQGSGQVSRRKAVRQFYRPGRGNRPGAGRALQS